MMSMKVYSKYNFTSVVTFCSSLALELQKLSGWNFALIIVGVILFVVGVCVAIVLAVLLTWRIKTGCTLTTGDLYLTLFVPHYTGSVSWWYWLLVAVSAVVSLTSLALWIAFGVYVSNNGRFSQYCTCSSFV